MLAPLNLNMDGPYLEALGSLKYRRFHDRWYISVYKDKRGVTHQTYHDPSGFSHPMEMEYLGHKYQFKPMYCQETQRWYIDKYRDSDYLDSYLIPDSEDMAQFNTEAFHQTILHKTSKYKV